MKNTLKFLGIIAVAAVAVSAITACPSEVDPGANYWTITWHLNGGAWPDAANPPSQVNKDEAFARPSPNPTKDGYAFTGWYTDDELTARYNFSSPVTGNLALYARWNSTSWNIIWELDGGEWTGDSPPEQVAKEDEAFLDRPSPNPIKKGYAFAGWYSDADLTAEYDFSLPLAADLTLYAAWERIYWVVTWHLDGGTAAGELPESVGLEAVLTEPGKPVKADHIFLGWHSDAALTTAYNFTDPVTADLDLYAKWDSNYRNIIWHLNGGAATATLPASIEKDTVLARPSPDPAKTGHTFGDWYSDAGLTAVYNFTASVTSDLTLYAKWDPEMFNITWHLDGGAWGGQQPPAQAAYGTVLTRPSPNPAKDGHAFRGWYTNAALTTVYTFTAPVTADLDLYARWADESAGGSARYLAFTSDIHWSSGSSSYPLPIYEQWMDKLMTQVDSLDYMGFCGDLGIPNESGGDGNSQFWNNVKALMDTAALYVDNGFITGDSGLPTKGNLFGLGNHEWYTSGGGNLNTNKTGYAQDRLFYNHTVIDEGDYIIYALGPVPGGTGGCAQQFVQTEIDRLSAYLEGAPYDVPIFIMAHHPIHIYYGGTPIRTTANADLLLAVLNEYPNVFFMWGHNHSVADPYWDKYHVAGNTITTTGTASSPGPAQTLNFTYFAPGAMRDIEYGGDNGDTGEYVKGKGTVAKIENGKVTLTYYDANCDPLEGNTHGGVAVINPVEVTVEGWGGPVIPRITVTFDKNNTDPGSAEASPRTIRVTPPATTVGTLPATPPTRAGHNFTGWNTQANGSGTAFTAATTVNASITVYAQWEARPYVPPYTVDLSGQTTRFATASNGTGGSVKLEFPAGFDVTAYSKFTITLNFLDSDQNRIATTASQYLAADFFKNWTGASTRPAAGDRLQTINPTGVSDNNSGDTNNGFTVTRDSAFNVNPEGLWVQRAGGNSLRYIEILEIRFHDDP